jgi:serine/threonine-protein kinase
MEADLASGQMVGEYCIESKIGAGGFGTVYRAEQPLIGKVVAVKVLNRAYSANPQMVSRFVAEARAVNQIRHRNIIDIFSFGMLDDKRQYFVMEYLDGMPFDAYVKSRGRLPPEEAIPILRQIAKALDAAHAAGIAHRDLKPENVFLAMDGDGAAFPKLLDFGIAKLLGESTSSGHKTRTGTPIGTPYYMSPEQCLGKNVDHRADVYSFGVMTHEVLTGKVPFDAEEMMSVMMAQMSTPPPAMSSVCPELPSTLDAPVLRMLAKSPEDRPASVADGLEALALAARDAGFDVTVAPVWRPGAGVPSGATPDFGAMTPEQLSLAAAKTLEASVLTPGSLPAPMGSPASSRGKNRAPVIVGGVMLVSAVVGVGAYFAWRSTYQVDSLPADSLSVVTSVDDRVQPTVPSATVPATSIPTVPSVPPPVRVLLQSVPKTVEVYLGTEPLTVTDGSVTLPHGMGSVELTFKASGYHDKVVSVVPSADSTVSVTLVRVAAGPGKRPKKPGSGEIEDPF